MSIQWEDSLRTGSIEIDLQHRELISRFHNFSTALEEGRAEEDLVTLLDFLKEYTLTHFDYEERVQEESDYPGLPEQRRQHRQFVNDIDVLRAEVNSSGGTLEQAIAIKGKLIRYIINHIRNTDRALGEFLSQTSKGRA